LAGAGLALLGTAYGQDPDPAMFSRTRAWKDLTTQCDFGPRPPETEAHLKCRDYIVDELKKSCEKVHLQPFEHVWTINGKTQHMWNIIGEQNWASSKVRMVLFAHWDTRPEADQEKDPVKAKMPIPGADDGASETAILIELARVLKVKPANVGVMYVFLDGEDLGPSEEEMYLGAIKFAQSLPTPKANYGILLDMVGNTDLHVPKEPSGEASAPELTRSLYDFAGKIGLQDTFPNTEGPSINDDHLPIIKAGLPTIDLIDFMDYYYTYWHTLQDTPEHCSPESLYKVGYLMQEWLRKPTPFQISSN
jgi:glutaminyl-peptide cyclotransferase